MSHEPGTTIKQLVELGRTPADCWRWRGVKNKEGVAHKQLNGKCLIARRWLWEMLFGPIPEGLVITTTCGSKECCNPHHLRCCFQAAANHAGQGTVLLPSDVREIREAKKKKTPNLVKHLALKHGVSVATINDVMAKRSWTKPKLRKAAVKQTA